MERPATEEDDPSRAEGEPEVDDAPATDGRDLAPELLESFLELMPDAAVVVDQGGHIVSGNGRVGELFGYDLAELVGRPIEVLVPERLRHQHRRDRADYAQGPTARAMGSGRDLVGRRRDGTEVPVDISLAPLGVGTEPLVVAGIRDASDRWAASAAQAQLAAVVRSTLDGVLTTRVDGRVTSWNAGAERMLGHHPGDLVGDHVSRLVPEEESLVFEELLAAAGEDVATSRDTSWRTAGGGLLPVAVSVSPLRAASGDLEGFSIVVRDITERKAAEEAQQLLLAEVRRSERWQSTMAQIRLELLSGAALEDALGLIADGAIELIEAQACLVVDGGWPPTVLASRGDTTGLADERLHGLVGEAVSSQQPQRAVVGSSGPGGDGGRAVLVVPVRGVSGGAFVVVTGDDELDGPQLGPVAALADQAALAAELDRARADRERLLLADDRERIARDLHDVVIQRLFAAGMGLQALSQTIGEARATERLSGIVDDLDRAIADLRGAIFHLSTPAARKGGLRAELRALAGELRDALGFEPRLQLAGPLDSAIPDEVGRALLAAARESLSNTARHARATACTIEVSTGRELVLVVEDDGVGFGELGRRSGLANLGQRAEALGGAIELGQSGAGGARVEWRVPLT